MDTNEIIRKHYSPPQRRPAPGGLFLVQDFVNAHFAEEPETGRERAPEPIVRWLRAFRLLPPNQRLRDDDVRQLLTLRRGLIALLEANDGHAVDARAVDALNTVASKAALAVRFEGGTPALAPLGSGADAIAARLLAAVQAAFADGTWQRLKVCGASDCRWAFFDTSKNRGGAWCSMAGCGNRAKARAFRQRHARKATPRR